MLLLETTSKRLSSFFNEQRPPYAILSHTWGTEEVSFQDLEELHKGSLRQYPFASSVSSRAGWRKIEACCDQALRDGFKWVWIDTCCIDKSSSAELSEAINSMFAWYRDSDVCYAFLSDVDEADEDISELNSSFRGSRWFTRGWTLQELLAPRRIIFFSSDWQVIGPLTKGSKLSQVASEITSIQTAFLEGLDLRKANVAMRMSWASERVTTRKEDMAYSLLGIFDVNMPLLYGEGTKAFDRLQEEILKTIYDHSLLAWGLLPWDQGYSQSDTEFCGILATSVTDFAGCRNHSICPRSANYNPSTGYQMTNEGLRVPLSLRAPRTRRERRDFIFVAILDCFSRQEPMRRIGIPLRKVEGGVFIRTGRSLWLGDIHPDAPPTGYGYVSKTIQIAVANDVARHQPSGSFRYPILVDFPPHYCYKIEYVHPWFEVEEDPYTVGSRSLRIKRRALEEVIQSSPNNPYAIGFVENCSTKWALWCDVLANIIRGRLPYSQVRPRPDSIILCVKLIRENYVKMTRQNYTLYKEEAPSYITFLEIMPIPGAPFLYSPICSLAPLSQHPSHRQSAHPSDIFHGLMGYKSLTVANETFSVRDMIVPDSLNNLRPAVLFKIGLENNEYLVPNVPLLQQTWTSVLGIATFIGHCTYILSSLLAYAFVILLLSVSGSTKTQTLYLAIWTLCFMPFIYEIKMAPSDPYSPFRRYEGIIVRIILVSIGIAVSLYPALQPILQWPTCTTNSNGTITCRSDHDRPSMLNA